MNATAKTAKTALHACACGGFKATDASGTVVVRTDCNAQTRRTFAPGHDARLKGFLIRAGREGMLITTPWGGAEQTPEKAAEHFGFAHMVREGIARPKATRKAKKVAAPAKVIGKVGRWTYEGTVTAGGKIFTYTDRKGATLMAETFTIVG
jgi:hypothetical protein